jgi:hypothetical protein
MNFWQRLLGGNPAAEVLDLMIAAHVWGKSNGWPGAQTYPQYARVRELGEKLYRSGGHQAMEQVAMYVIAEGASRGFGGTLLSIMWDGIGVPQSEGGSGVWRH